jgi:hypothetical protein
MPANCRRIFCIPTNSWNVDLCRFMHPYGWKISGRGHILEEVE